MKAVSLTVDQITEGIDQTGLDAAVKIAQTKIKALGLEQLDAVELRFKIGPTNVSFSAETLPEPETESAPEE
ncbi:MAG: hypothetical protein AAF609_12625 [Cyanobacteria bacterium P01_C01_bin.120]